MRWKAFFYLHPEAKAEEKETYGFKSRKTPPQIDDRMKFEDDLLQTIENIQFRNVKSTFLSKLRNDVDNIKKSERLFVPADKTSNYYKLDKSEYTKLVKDNTTAKYKPSEMKPVSLVHYGDSLSANLDQAMSKKNGGGKEKEKTSKIHAKNTHTHSSLGLTGPNFAFRRNFW